MLSFRLRDEFVRRYEGESPGWGFAVGGGNTLGELAFLRTYSRALPSGRKETWVEVVRRAVEGCYSIQKDWCLLRRLPWDEDKAHRSATEMFDRIFYMKFTPPGRGLWMMGTSFVHERQDSTALQNCAFVSTSDLERATCFLMEASMLGVGVGFDVEGRGKPVYQPPVSGETHVVPDDREGWVESVRRLVRGYLTGEPVPSTFDYSRVRPRGAPIRGFGGVAAGPGPLRELHDSIHWLFRRVERTTEATVVDLMNLIGRCVVAGNVRRSAEIALGPPTDGFLDLKDYDRNPYRAEWGWASNNSVIAPYGRGNYDDVVHRVSRNGEPGVFWLDVARAYGRITDGPNDRDWRASGTNPCSEQTLESEELCNLVETFPTRHRDLNDYKRTLKFAYLWAKTVTLLPTRWGDTNAIMLRNRRIGCSMSGIVEFIAQRGLYEMRNWMKEGYETLRQRDDQYSEWLTIRPSVKMTSVKPSGTVSLLAGTTPGVHHPVASSRYLRRMQLAKNDPIALELERAGYHLEESVQTPNSVVVEFPVVGANLQSQDQASLWYKTSIAGLAQEFWADNQVSATVTFDPKREVEELPHLLVACEGKLKSVSFQPLNDVSYPQPPYEDVSEEYWQRSFDAARRVDWEALYEVTDDAIGERYCDTEACEI